MSGRPVKHSLTLKGHRTSVSLEAEFWESFQRLARGRGISVDELAAEVDAGRDSADEAASQSGEGASFPPTATMCHKCSTKALVLMDGCQTCLNCGYSKCG